MFSTLEWDKRILFLKQLSKFLQLKGTLIRSVIYWRVMEIYLKRIDICNEYSFWED